MKMNVPMLPLSQPNAVGLILAHGKAKNNAQAWIQGKNCADFPLPGQNYKFVYPFN